MAMVTSSNEFYVESNQFPNGPTSRTTSEQSVGMFNNNFEGTLQSLMNVQKQISDMNHVIKQKDEEIKQLKEENDKLKKEIKQYASSKSTDHLVTGRNNGHKIDELKRAVGKVIEEVLSSEHPTRPIQRTTYNPASTAPTTSTTIHPVSIQVSNPDVNNPLASTNDSKPITPILPDESTVIAGNHMNPSSNNNQEPNFEYGSRPSDQDIVNQATNEGQRHRYTQHTIFVSWPGTMSIDNLRELFDSQDIEDIRYMTQKQFAHVDMKSEQAMQKALDEERIARYTFNNHNNHHNNHNNHNAPYLNNTSPENENEGIKKWSSNPYTESGDQQNGSAFGQKQEHIKSNGEMV
ncbi:13710_t:CDS:10 [Funneliformis caledonium]|uniref:13710_t:CDS:1 n=1 Tax=Funneliformis caledonium TaxID=1117310 RepID=A0A9N9BIU2_9GLOM|nr:13710_t:CDS:10 [Funneliformis caledonium]